MSPNLMADYKPAHLPLFVKVKGLMSENTIFQQKSPLLM